MGKTSNYTEKLDEYISVLEMKQGLELIEMKSQINEVYESLRPINILKHTIEKYGSASDLKEDIVHSISSLALGLLSNNVNKNASFWDKVKGNFVQALTTFIVSKDNC